MTEEKTSLPELDSLFKNLSDEVDTTPSSLSGADLNLEALRPLSLQERLATWTLNGRLPLLALIWLGCWLAHFSGRIGVLVGSLIPTLICAWILAPVTRARYGFSLGRLAAVCLVLPIFSLGCLLVPDLLAHHLGGSPQHLEYFAHTVQMELESFFQWGPLFLYGALASTLVLLTPKIRAQFPWVDVAQVNPWPARLLLAALAFSLAIPSAMLFDGLTLDIVIKRKTSCPRTSPSNAEEISFALEIPVGTVRSRLSGARKRLAERLKMH